MSNCLICRENSTVYILCNECFEKFKNKKILEVYNKSCQQDSISTAWDKNKRVIYKTGIYIAVKRESALAKISVGNTSVGNLIRTMAVHD